MYHSSGATALALKCISNPLGNLVYPDPSNPASDSPGASTAPFSRASRQAIPDGDRQLAGTSVAVASHLVAQIGEAHPV